MKRFFCFLTIIFFSVNILCKADEGMWLPLLINKNMNEMQKLGLKLTAEDIYNVNNSSIKDAIVNFGNFCTGEVISKEGLVLTNHHCGFDAIQSQSSVSNDLLTNGFWAKTRAEELPSPGLTVTFLIRMEDVTEKILSNIPAGTEWARRKEKIKALSQDLIKTVTEGTNYNAEVKSFFEGNQFYMFVYETYKDVRMVGAPPSSIGKFGGDTDNWMWPRHTGDFSLFRIYMSPDGKPAEYSKDNIPLKPKHHLPVSLKGIKEGDFAMVMGYPGGTERYLPSEGVKLTYEQSNPAKIKIREKRLSLMKEDMEASEEVKIKYAAKYAHISNYYKYFIGQNQGLKRLNIIGKKKAQEEEFQSWVKTDADRTKLYGSLLSDYEQIYKDYRSVNLPYIYLEEAAFGIEIIELAYKADDLSGTLQSNGNKKEIDEAVSAFKKEVDEHFKNYNLATDKKIFAALLSMYYKDVDKAYHPSIFSEVEKKYKGDFSKFADAVYKKSIFAYKDKLDIFLANPDIKILDKDPAYQLMSSILGGFTQSVAPSLRRIYSKLDITNNLFTEAIMKMRKDENLYPDANFTMRLTYGTVQDYYPKDAVQYLHRTTLNGVMEKEDPSNEEFIVPDKLKELFNKKDFGNYAQNGELYVCFITNNDITGGNSGSPVINGEGHLIGTAFDGNWEAMSGDIIFEPALQRCISTDIRYILFIIDKFAGAGYLVKEMTLIENTEIPSEIKGGSLNEKSKEIPLKQSVKTKDKKVEKVY